MTVIVSTHADLSFHSGVYSPHLVLRSNNKTDIGLYSHYASIISVTCPASYLLKYFYREHEPKETDPLTAGLHHQVHEVYNIMILCMPCMHVIEYNIVNTIIMYACH